MFYILLQIVLEIIILMSKTRFLNLGTSDILLRVILCCGGLSHALQIFNNIPGFYLLDASNIPLSCDIQTCLQTLPGLPWGAKLPPLRIIYLQDFNRWIRDILKVIMFTFLWGFFQSSEQSESCLSRGQGLDLLLKTQPEDISLPASLQARESF